MFRSARQLDRFFKGVVWLLGSVLLTGGLVSCSGNSSSSNNNSDSPVSLTLSSSSIKLTAGAAGQQTSLLLAAPAGTGMTTVVVSGLPTGVTISPATLSLTPGVALPLTLAAAASATSTATVTFTTTVNGQTASTQASLSVQAAAPPPADFSLTVSPTSVSLIANGATSTVSAQATGENGFAGSVQVAITGLPAGLTASTPSFTLNVGSAPAASNVTFTATTGTAPGSYTAVFTATSGAITHTASLAITVTAAPPPQQPDFSLAISPQTLSLAIGGAGQAVQLTATALNGFSGTASVALSGLPSGVTANPTTVSLTPGTPQSITLTAGNSAQAGSASVVFTATSGSLTHSATLTLSV
jgi:hypothetical protein